MVFINPYIIRPAMSGGCYLEDDPMTCKWLKTMVSKSHEWGCGALSKWRNSWPTYGGDSNHLLWNNPPSVESPIFPMQFPNKSLNCQLPTYLTWEFSMFSQRIKHPLRGLVHQLMPHGLKVTTSILELCLKNCQAGFPDGSDDVRCML